MSRIIINKFNVEKKQSKAKRVEAAQITLKSEPVNITLYMRYLFVRKNKFALYFSSFVDSPCGTLGRVIIEIE